MSSGEPRPTAQSLAPVTSKRLRIIKSKCTDPQNLKSLGWVLLNQTVNPATAVENSSILATLRPPVPSAVRQLSFFKRAGIRAAAWLFRGLIWTLRIRLSDQSRAWLAEHPTSNLILIWHNRLALALAAFHRKGGRLPLTGLVSASGDGAILAEVMHAFGIQTARGSSSRRAMQATRELFAALDAGRNIVITPDGPRGPIYTVKSGAADIGSDHAKAVCLLAFNCKRCWRFKSWDRFMVPKPFATIEVDVEKIEAEVDKELLQSKLMALTHDD